MSSDGQTHGQGGGLSGPLLSFALIAYVGAVGALANFLVPEISPAAPQPTVIGKGSTSSSSGPAVAALSFPLDYSASVKQCPQPRPFDGGCDERFYATKSSKEAQ